MDGTTEATKSQIQKTAGKSEELKISHDEPLMQYHNDNTASKSGQLAHTVLAYWLHVIHCNMVLLKLQSATASTDCQCNHALY